jgi:hypothetical protein
VVQYRIRRFGIQSTALTVGILYFLLSLLLLPIFYLASGGAIVGALPTLTLVLIPFIYAVVGYVGSAIGCWLYNIVAGWSGGIAFTLEPAEGA